MTDLEIEHLKTKKASILDANIRNADIQYSNIQEASIGNIQAREINTQNADIDEANIRMSTIKRLKVTDLEFDSISTQYKLNLENATISNLDITKSNIDYADISELKNTRASLEEATIKNINISSGVVKKISIDKADINDLTTKNINLKNLFSEDGKFDNITVKNSLTISNELESKVSITTPLLNAKGINVKKLNVDRLDFNPIVEKVYITFQDEICFIRDGKKVLEINKDGATINSSPISNNTDSTPIGTIVAFFGKEIPEGWEFCDGNNGTPDLRESVICNNKNFEPNFSGNQFGFDRKELNKHLKVKHINYIMKVK